MLTAIITSKMLTAFVKRYDTSIMQYYRQHSASLDNAIQ